MNTDWWSVGASIAAAGGTVFLGVMALLTIRQADKERKQSKRERLLDEIEEWGQEIADCCANSTDRQPMPIEAWIADSEKRQSYSRHLLYIRLNTFQSRCWALEGKASRMKRISAEFRNGKSLSDLVKQVDEDLYSLNATLRDRIEQLDFGDIYLEEDLDYHGKLHNIDKSARELSNMALELKIEKSKGWSHWRHNQK